MIKVLFPEQLVKLVGQREIETSLRSNIQELIADLEDHFPGLKARVSNRNFVLFFINGEDIRFLEGDQTPLKDGDEVSIIAAIAGG